jgi:pimeloyl-ACP methyl ester carboxylesterase
VIQSWTASDGVEIVADVSGDRDARTVVLLHGAGQTRHSWSAAVPALTDAGYHVINCDSRGHGESGWSADGNYSFQRLAADLRTVLADVRGPAALVGASMGGFAAMQAVAEGLRPGALVLVDVVLQPERQGVEKIRKFMRGNPHGFASLAEAADAVAAYNPHRPRPEDPAGLLKNLLLRADGRYYWHWDPAVIAGDRADDLNHITRLVEGLRMAASVPTLLIRGGQSDVVGDAGVAALREIIPGLDVFNLANAGHMVAGDSNDVFNAAMLDFLTRIFPPTRIAH